MCAIIHLGGVLEALPVLRGVPALTLSFPLAFLSFLQEYWPRVPGPVVLWLWGGEGRRAGGPPRSAALALPCFACPAPRMPGRRPLWCWALCSRVTLVLLFLFQA